jgi:predicted nucleic acid-binding protein
MILCVDANVFVAASTESEVHHIHSGAIFRRAEAAHVHVVCPTLVLAEVGAAVARSSGKADVAWQTLAVIRQRPDMTLIPLDATRAHRAAELAIAFRLRGADSAYAQVAEEYNAVLITWDAEMLERIAGAVSVMTPAQWTASLT